MICIRMSTHKLLLLCLQTVLLKITLILIFSSRLVCYLCLNILLDFGNEFQDVGEIEAKISKGECGQKNKRIKVHLVLGFSVGVALKISNALDNGE